MSWVRQGNVSSTSVFSQERVGFAETQQPFRQSIKLSKHVEDDFNPSMRLQSVASTTQIGGKHIQPSLPLPDGLVPGDSLVNSVTDVRTDGVQSFLFSSSQSQLGGDAQESLTGTQSSNKSQYWTPHEMHLQRAVRRRGASYLY